MFTIDVGPPHADDGHSQQLQYAPNSVRHSCTWVAAQVSECAWYRRILATITEKSSIKSLAGVQLDQVAIDFSRVRFISSAVQPDPHPNSLEVTRQRQLEPHPRSDS